MPVIGEQTDAWTRASQVRLGMVWLRRKGDKVVALNAECPHLGCKVAFRADHKGFACPCHDSSFSIDGEHLGGPAPRSMDPLETRVVDGQVEVRFVRFRAQVKERVEIG
jgi:Rieske Fe-S protein